MLKAAIGKNVVLGLSRLNIEKLMEGKHIEIDGDQLGLMGKKLFVVFGETEEAIAKHIGIPEETIAASKEQGAYGLKVN